MRFADLPTDRPTPARCYDYGLGGKDNFEVDRRLVLDAVREWPGNLDLARHNRLYLYRAVRFLARDAGIDQFLDLGSGLPTANNVHQVAQRFRPGAHVVYVDHDPIVMVHARALLVEDESTTVIEADMTRPEDVLGHPETRRMIDFSRPVGLLMFGVPHCIPDDDDALHTIHGHLEAVKPGSYLAISHVVADTVEDADGLTKFYTDRGLAWRTRTPDHVASWLTDLEQIPPGLKKVTDWRPDPDQPPLPDVDARLRPYVDRSSKDTSIYEFGGVLRKLG